MRKTVILITSMFLFTSCKSYLLNEFFEQNGIYQKNVKTEKLIGNNEIVFVPIHHLGTHSFYNDVKNKVDSLKNLDYKIFYEMVLTEHAKSSDTTKQKIIDTTMMLKFRKSFGLKGLSKSGASNYKEFFEGRGLKLKKILIPQPKLSALGLKGSQCENVDATTEELIKAYELKYGKIILEEYDLKTNLFDAYDRNKCKYKIDKKIFEEFIVNYRNNIVLSKIKQNKSLKIAIVYGKNHFIGIKDQLQKIGYKMIEN
ncbi:hypothetical protein EQG63_03140 [Flavobacterium amnicola]|uniref:TraB/GumN family protein n=1 Tax=Flavobacterium amnicola TaxID=2506422 RepID=A0A4Q1K5P7_9FLAO|nr:hypothetical protein [Flavobacterium amnicola]RXR20947.1 hypothetical protein EQG63_03140 [Flavobacterium amnicola]